jgi:hypothetical protein
LFLQELYDLLILTRPKNLQNVDKPVEIDNKEKVATNKASPKSNKNQQNQEHFLKKDKENIFKSIEEKLFAAFSNFCDPFWANLLLIENSKDYQYNKYYTLACLISKSFEKWVSLPANNQLISNYKSTNDLKISAFIIACKHHLLLVDSIAKAYSLTKDNDFLLPYLRVKTKWLDYKDKAILISSIMMHDFFNFEEVNKLFICIYLIHCIRSTFVSFTLFSLTFTMYILLKFTILNFVFNGTLRIHLLIFF